MYILLVNLYNVFVIIIVLLFFLAKIEMYLDHLTMLTIAQISGDGMSAKLHFNIIHIYKHVYNYIWTINYWFHT